ncbi:MAG: hypothetical protein JW966_16055 [Anaerolineae bacterium]|nr:hypothetical protein [Anaerolineae bacterium]
MRFKLTTVEATFTPTGWPVPSSVHWGGERLPVIDVGRRWKADDGIHILVRVPDGRVFELHTNGALWRACVIATPPHFA